MADRSPPAVVTFYSEYALADADPDNRLDCDDWTEEKYTRLEPLTLYGHPIFKRISGIPDNLSAISSGDSLEEDMESARHYTLEFSRRNIPVMIDPEGQYAERLRKTLVYFFTKELGLAHVLEQIDANSMKAMGYLNDVDTNTWVLTHNSFSQPFSLGSNFQLKPQTTKINYYSLKAAREYIIPGRCELSFDRQEDDDFYHSRIKYTGSDLHPDSPLLKFRMVYRKKLSLHYSTYGCGVPVVKDFHNEMAVNTVAGELGQGSLKQPLHIMYLIPGLDEVVQLNTEDLEDVIRGKRIGDGKSACGYHRTRHFGLTFILQCVNRHGLRMSKGKDFLKFQVKEVGDDHTDLYDCHVGPVVMSEDLKPRKGQFHRKFRSITETDDNSVEIYPTGEGYKRRKELFHALTSYPRIKPSEINRGLILTPKNAIPFKYRPSQMITNTKMKRVWLDTADTEFECFHKIWIAHINELVNVLSDYARGQIEMLKQFYMLRSKVGEKEAVFRMKMADCALTMEHLRLARMITAQLVEKTVEFVKRKNGESVSVEYKKLDDYETEDITWRQVLGCDTPIFRKCLQENYDNNKLLWEYVNKINTARALAGALENKEYDQSGGPRVEDAAAHNHLTYKDFKQLSGFPWGLVRSEASLSSLKDTGTVEREALCNIIHQIRLKQLSVYRNGIFETLLKDLNVDCWSACLPSSQYLTNVGTTFNMSYKSSPPPISKPAQSPEGYKWDSQSSGPRGNQQERSTGAKDQTTYAENRRRARRDRSWSNRAD